jgi:type II restriction enzyme
MKQPFDELIKNLKPVISDFSFFTDFEKVVRNVKKQSKAIEKLETVFKSLSLEDELIEAIEKSPEIIGLLANLLAIRKDFDVLYDNEIIHYNIQKKNLPDSAYIAMMEQSGIANLIRSNLIKDLSSYLLGVEVGLDTNARKNRGGTAMESLVEGYIKQLNLPYHVQVNKKRLKDSFNLDIDSVIDDEGLKSANKVFDFVVLGSDKLYLIETNFYSGGGSKLNETARSYKQLAKELLKLNNVEFIWITDGVGWTSARGNLKEAYDVITHLYTIKDLESGILTKVIL